MNRSRIVLDMPEHEIASALRAEPAAFQSALAGLTVTDLGRPSPCPPWTVGELACHVIIGASRIAQALGVPEDGGAGLVATIGYYRHDARFSAQVNADRIEVARTLAGQLGGPSEIAAELARVSAEADVLLTRAPADRVVRTRHGDRMLLADFARTRVVELGVHGLGLGHPSRCLTSQ